jgi:CubicO group peptidase (beta-lactamase class C family)
VKIPMSRRILATGFALFTLAAVCAATSPWARVDDYLHNHARDGEPGFVVLVAAHRKPVYAQSVGVTRIEHGQALTVDTPFNIASVAKVLTATAVMSLVQDGTLDLNHTVGDYLSDAPGYLKPVTLERLLTHTGGVPDYPDSLAGEFTCMDNDDVLHWLAKKDGLEFEPGTDVAYSNAAFVLLARIVAATTGKPFKEVLVERVIRPAGMKHTRVVDRRDEWPQDRAVGYARRKNDVWETADYDQCTLGPGGVFASASDLLAFDQALRSGRLLDDGTRARMFEPGRLANGEIVAYAHGWIAGMIRRGPLKGLDVTQMLGNLNGYIDAFRRFTHDEVTVIWLSNRGEPLYDAGIEDAAIAAGLLHPPAASTSDGN